MNPGMSKQSLEFTKMVLAFYWECSGTWLGIYMNPLIILLEYNWNSMIILWEYHGDSMRVQLEYRENTTRVQSENDANTVRIQ